jgi:arylsulfatase A-like enzyme
MKNLLLVMIDCARTEKTLGGIPGGSPETERSARLPFLDDLRRRGATWTRYCAVSSTTTPNFATMFTGLPPSGHGIVEHSRHTLRDVPTIAEILREAGWHTRAEVTGPLVPEAGLGRGFDVYRHRDRSDYLHEGFGRALAELLPTLPRPWFLCLHLWEAHAPYQNPSPFDGPSAGFGPYDRALSLVDWELGRALAGIDYGDTTVVVGGDHGERLEADYRLHEARGGTEAEVLRCWRSHLASNPPPLDYDAWFARAKRDLGEATARIYAHNVLGHGFHLTEELIRVPLVVVDPDRVVPGSTNDSLRSQLDLMPTLLDLVGVRDERAPTADRSFLTAPAPEKIYVEANGSGGKKFASRCYLRGARSRDWKFWRIEGGGEERRVLWNLAEDPRETTNLATERPDRVADLESFVDRRAAHSLVGTETALSGEEERRLEATLKELGYL